MVLGAILGTILGSKSHPKIDQKINQNLDRFLMDFGSQFGSIWPQFWLQKSIQNQSRNLKEKEPRMDMCTSTRRTVQGTKNGSGEGPKNQQDTDRCITVCLTRPAVLRRILEVFLGPWTLTNEYLAEAGCIFSEIQCFMPESVLD